jgi:hypothetical protein
MCLAAGRTVPATCVDHIEPHRGGYIKFRLGQWKIFEDRQNPSSIRLQARLRRRLTEDHIGALGRQAPSPAPATVGPRQAGDEARTDGIGTPANTEPTPLLRLAFPVNKIPISAAIEGRGAQAMVLLVLR